MEKLLELDGNILLWVQEHLRFEGVTYFMKFITYLGNAGALWIGVTLLFLIIPKTRRLGIVCACSLLCTFLIDNVILKNVVARTRPYEVVENLHRLIGAQTDYSFPSGHAGASFAVAVVIFKEAPKKLGIPALILAILIAISRIYVGVHYPSDVIVGTAVGTIMAVIACMVYHRIVKSKDKIYKYH